MVSGAVGDITDPDRVGIVFAKRDKELQAAITLALRDMKGDGTVARLRLKWMKP